MTTAEPLIFSKEEVMQRLDRSIQFASVARRVTMALLRLQRRKLLRKTSKTIDGKKHVAYVW